MSEANVVKCIKLDAMLVAGIHARVPDRASLIPLFDQLSAQCNALACGPAFALIHWDSGISGLDVEACIPVSQAVNKGEIYSRQLEEVDVMSMTFHGRWDDIRKGAYFKFYEYALEHGINLENTSHETYLEYHPDAPERNVTLVQRYYIPWEDRFVRNVKRVLGETARQAVARELEGLSTESRVDERANLVISAVQRFDDLATEEQKYEVVSRCAHTFSQARIDGLRNAYEKNHNVDDVLEVMWQDHAWYEKPHREGNIIYETKVPGNAEAYAKATTPEEKRHAYCHCAITGRCLERMSPTFCQCGAGWYRQIWEGILGVPVWVELLKSLPMGDDTCQFAIHLPI